MKLSAYLHICISANFGLSVMMSLIKYFEDIIYRIDEQKSNLNNQDLLKICEPLGKLFNAELNPHLPHEIAESALNLLLQEKYVARLLQSNLPQKESTDILKPLISRLPTQTWRSREQTQFQQFSTPPTIAYLLAFILNLKTSETVLEPSAGTGSLVIWASSAGAKVITNEIDNRRRELLAYLGFEPTAFNAEFIDDFLAPEVTVDVVMMNPPFSANGGRTKNSSKYGFRHVESALERLKGGGKFGIIFFAFGYIFF